MAAMQTKQVLQKNYDQQRQMIQEEFQDLKELSPSQVPALENNQ